MTITTEGGTVFLVRDGNVWVTEPDTGERILIPEDDLQEFFERYFTTTSEPDAAIEDEL